MKRTIGAIVIAIIIAFSLGAIQVYIDVINIANALGIGYLGDWYLQISMSFEVLVLPFSLLMQSFFIPLVALAIAGFISGLVSKSRKGIIVVSVVVLLVLFLGHFLLKMASGYLDFSALLTDLQDKAIDLGIAFFLLFIPGIIGASITQE